MLTKQEAIQFLQSEWKMKDVEQEIKNDREKFLNKLIVTIHERVPFHLLFVPKLSTFPPNERTFPNFDESDYLCMSGYGGNCTMINTFTARLLTSLGYTVLLCESIVTSTTYSPHIIVIVKDLVNTGDIHVVDCGLGLPSFRAISLNFEKESPVYVHSFLEYKFIKHDGKVLRMHGDGDLMVRNNPPEDGLDFIVGKWRRFCEFTVEPFEITMVNVINKVGLVLRFLKMVPPRAAIFPGGKAILLNGGYTLHVEQEDKTLKQTILKPHEAFQVFKKYFPSINEGVVQEAYSLWRDSKSKL